VVADPERARRDLFGRGGLDRGDHVVAPRPGPARRGEYVVDCVLQRLERIPTARDRDAKVVATTPRDRSLPPVRHVPRPPTSLAARRSSSPAPGCSWRTTAVSHCTTVGLRTAFTAAAPSRSPSDFSREASSSRAATNDSGGTSASSLMVSATDPSYGPSRSP